MSSRKLTKAAFEKTLNEKGAKFTGDKYLNATIDLTGMDDCFEVWKAQREEARDQGSEGTVFPGYGTWLRKLTITSNTIFNERYDNWVRTYA